MYRILRNENLLIHRGDSKPPNVIHSGQAKKVVDKRRKVYQAAKELHPQRFNRGLRNWKTPEYVSLNPIKDSEILTEKQINNF